MVDIGNSVLAVRERAAFCPSLGLGLVLDLDLDLDFDFEFEFEFGRPPAGAAGKSKFADFPKSTAPRPFPQRATRDMLQ